MIPSAKIKFVLVVKVVNVLRTPGCGKKTPPVGLLLNCLKISKLISIKLILN